MGARITIAGAGSFEILDIDGLNVTLSGNATATVSDASVVYYAPTYRWVSPRGYTFTMAAAASKVVADTYLSSTSSRVILMPTNSAAATLQAGPNALYISSKAAGASFTVSTASGAAAAGTETFDYIIVD